MACSDTIFDFDNDNHLASWIKDVSFIEPSKEEIEHLEDLGIYNRSWVDFRIDFEIWNPGPFVIYYQSSTTAFGLPYTITMNENHNISIESVEIFINDGGGLACSSTLIRPGVYNFSWNGEINFNNSFSNITAPTGTYTFKIGNENWIKTYPFTVQITENSENKTISEKPVDWGKGTVYLGNPPLFIWIGTALVAIFLTFKIRREKNREILKKG